MKLRILLRLAVQSILKNRTRAMLTMLGIIIGVAAVIIMVAVGYGARSRIHEQINNLGTNMIVITPGASSSGGVSQGAQAFATLTLADVDKIRSQSDTVAAVSPVVVVRSQVMAAGGNWRTSINGVDADYQTIRDWQTDSGTFFEPDDVRAARSVAVLGRTVAQRIFAGSEPVGQEIQIAALRFKVMGVLAPKGQTASGSDSDDVILIPYTTASSRLTGRSRIPQILASTASADRHPGRAGRDHHPASRVPSHQRRRRRRLHRPESDGPRRRGGEQHARDDAPARRDCVHLAARGRHRHHEHHAGVGHRADAGDRPSPRNRGSWLGRPDRSFSSRAS